MILRRLSGRLTAALLLPAALVLGACASPSNSGPTTGDVSKLSSVKLVDKGKDVTPVLEFAKPLDVTEDSSKVLKAGDGAEVKAGQKITYGLLGYNGKEGKVLQDAYADKGQTVVLDDAFKTNNKPFYDAAIGAKVGSDILIALKPQQGADYTALVDFKIYKAEDVKPALSKPEGTTVAPVAGLPTVTEKDGKPVIDVKGVKEPAKLVSQDLITGKGDVVKATDTIVANYTGVRLADGKVFDSSFDRGQTASFSLQQVIKGWTQGLAGKTVGSRVLLVIPGDLAYGKDQKTAGEGRPAGTLVFVVDILGVK